MTRAPGGAVELLVTPDEAARRLSISRAQVYRLMGRGELLYVKIGRLRRVPVAELERISRPVREAG